jgi:predicted  nucleic acid-binding Zn-ribbon protein
MNITELEDELAASQKRVEDAQNDLDWAMSDLSQNACKSNFQRHREAEQKLKVALAAHEELWIEYQDAYAWETEE